MDSIFRQSALMRPKWDRMHGSQTYGNKTINNAILKNGATREESRAEKNKNKVMWKSNIENLHDYKNILLEVIKIRDDYNKDQVYPSFFNDKLNKI